MQRRTTTQDLSWFLDLHRNKQLDLEPPYQRRSVWTRKDRTFFLDTIFNNYPSPPIFLHKSINENGEAIYHVVDGKQRLETILMYTNNKLGIPKEFSDVALQGKKWKDLQGSEDYKKRFWNYVFSVEFLDVIEDAVVKSVFDRLNRNSRNLKRQELRHAKFDGWLVRLAEAESEKEEWRRLNIVTASRAKRMWDVQFISELILVVLKGGISGFDQDALDMAYAEYEDPYETFPNFSEQDITEKLEKIKSIMVSLEDTNGCISAYAKGVVNFYSIWSLVALNLEKITDTDLLASAYKSFMEKVDELGKVGDLEDAMHKLDSSIYQTPYSYYQGTQGANTELPQRASRLNALQESILM